VREFGRGIALLLRGFAWWGRHPRAMALGLIPAALVGIVLVAGLVTLGTFLPALTESATGFADGWPGFWAIALRVAVGTAIFGGALVIAIVSFTALTLIVGEPFYDRIWRGVERELGDVVPDEPYGFWRSVGDGLSLVGRGLLVALVAALVGLVPVLGGVLGFVTGTLLTGWVIVDELSSRALTARGIDRAARRALLRRNRARALGFGVATQLCFLVPLGGVAVMPAAVAGSTMLARGLVGEADAMA
jgi:CysZ protein